MAPGRDLVATTPEAVAATQDYLRACVDLAAAVGAPSRVRPLLRPDRTGLADDRRRARPTAYAEWREHLAPVADYAGERGVRLGIEPLNRYETSLVNTVDQALTGLGPLLGAGAWAWPSTPTTSTSRSAAAPTRSARRASTSCTCRSAAATAAPRAATRPTGRRSCAALDEVGYDGALTIESFTPDNASIAVAASIWRPLAASPDDLARDGLAFLRSLLAEGDTHA